MKVKENMLLSYCCMRKMWAYILDVAPCFFCGCDVTMCSNRNQLKYKFLGFNSI